MTNKVTNIMQEIVKDYTEMDSNNEGYYELYFGDKSSQKRTTEYHQLSVMDAIISLVAINKAIKKLSKSCNGNIGSIANKLASYRRLLLLNDAAYADANTIITAYGSEFAKQLAKETLWRAEHDEADL